MTDFAIEDSIRRSSVALFICGVDEVGRGALFGPVVAGAVILDPDHLPIGLTDSKKLSPRSRANWAVWLYHHARAVAVSWVWNDDIDRINILQATRRAMVEAVRLLPTPADYLLIDGPINLDIKLPQLAIIGGDQKSLSIAAASVIAKVLRDGLMKQMAKAFPAYNFDKNKGYSTKSHRSMLSLNGPTIFHRMSFRKG